MLCCQAFFAFYLDRINNILKMVKKIRGVRGVMVRIKNFLKKTGKLYHLLRGIYTFIYKGIVKKILFYLPRATAHKIIYWEAFGKKLDLKNPKDLNQMIHWLIVYKYGEKEAELYDKYKAKQYIKSLNIADLNVAKLYKKYTNVNQIILDELPEKFVLKTTHGCSDTEICTNKSTFDFYGAKNRLKKAVKREFTKWLCEYFTVNVEKAIICEEYIEDSQLTVPIDYKFHCFNGITKAVMVCTERNKKARYDYFDVDWNYLDWSKEEYRCLNELNKPANWKRMVEIAEQLSSQLPFVRVDLYNVGGKIYFGEFTFTPFDGLIRNTKQHALDYLGGLITEGGLR